MDVSKAFQSTGRIVKKVAVSLFVSSGVLAIANVDTIWQEQQHRHDYSEVRQEARRTLHERMPAIREGGLSQPTMTDKLSAALAQDELGEQNPFANLSTLDPLNSIFKKGVIGFQRQAYRGPDYQEEAGYDLLEYEIEHPDHSHSTVLAYLERPLVDGGSAKAGSEEPKRIPVVLLMETQGGLSKQTLYRSSQMVEQIDLTLSQAQALVNHKLNSGIPFISVSR